MQIKAILKTIMLIFAFGALSACSQPQAPLTNHIKVGTISGPETELMEVAQKVAASKHDLKIEIIAFSDYAMPNEALSDGSIDANAFQHAPYLDAAIKSKGYKIVAIAKTFVYPMGVYSKKVKKIGDLKEGATVAIPNDPSNEGRALLLLEKAGLIKLKANVGTNGTIIDIISNPKKLVFKEVEAAQLTRALSDVDLATINTNYAMLAGLLPSRDALLMESPDSPYANLIVVRESQKDDPNLKKLVESFQSEEVIKKAETLFKGQAIPAWK